MGEIITVASICFVITLFGLALGFVLLQVQANTQKNLENFELRLLKMDSINTLTIILGINSIILIGLILNQNDSSKDSVTNQKSNSSINPFEKITWISLSLEFIVLLIKIKNNVF